MLFDFSSYIIFSWPPYLFLVFIFIWGVAVVADSPQFSSLVAENAPVELKGTALTIVNSIGFSITIISIQLFTFLLQKWEPTMVFLVLAIGPLMGVAMLLKNAEHDSLEEVVS